MPDENMLIPVLHSIPSSIDLLNVTMGFPFRNSTLYNLLELIRNLHKNVRKSGRSMEFHYKDVIHVFMNPYVKFYDASAAYEIVNNIKKNNIVYITRAKLMKSHESISGIIDKIFVLPENGKDAVDYLYDLLDLLSESIDESSEDFVKFEREYFFAVYEHLNHLTDIFSKTDENIDTETFWRIFFEVVRNLRIPFTGEPLHGLQLMGLPETRTLDFDNLFIMSMNEGIIPAGDVKSSFIPYSLRKAFRLPTFEDEDCLTAYNFYRLLQRAKNVYLIYNTEVDVFSSGEKSRFLLQMENELVKRNTNVKLDNIITKAKIPRFSHGVISIPKDEKIINKLKEKKHFSPSDLIIYNSCRLKFYFRNLAGLDIQQGVEEYFSPSSFGNIVHALAHILYKDYKGKIIDKEVINKLKQEVELNYDKLLKIAFENLEGLTELEPELTGKNLLYKNVIKKLMLKILDKDCEDTPFTIINLESEIKGKFPVKIDGSKLEVNLYGRIDRIDSKGGQIRIIDYKTGYFMMNNAGKKSIDEYFEHIFTDPSYKETFQAYFYAYLYQKNNRKPVRIAIYPLQRINEGLSYFNENNIPLEEIDMFEEKLEQLMAELFSANVPFTQTEDKNNCMFCIYKSICYKE
ncbi:MAG: PD-(D/E)XK nuclease family protein [Ignavibacteriae bacterium]|nr:MAG: PD-(D/E)XK nuclease family protein [Ignavibacteriota bacterium]